VSQKHSRSRSFSGFLDSGTSFTGDLSFEGTIRIDGNVSGSIRTHDILIVGESAVIRADIRAGAVQIHGQVVGDVSCSGRVEICPGGRLEGNLETPRLVIEDGGFFEGRSHTIQPKGEDAEAPDPRAEESASGKEPDTVPAGGGLRWRILGKTLESVPTPTASDSDDPGQPPVLS
jgi:cytoskeletal protein CcmA (bactofilin family)